MKKPVYIPSMERFNHMEAERQEMQTFREQMRILGLALAVGIVGAVCYFL